MGKKYYVSREESWQKEVARGQEVDEGIGVLLNIDLYLTSAFDILEHDKYGEMQTYNYSSVKKEIEKCRDKNDDIVNYARTIHGTLKDKENDFHKQFSKALEELSKLNINDYQVENTLGITEFKEVMATRDSDPITIEQKKSKITYADIMGKTDMMGLSKQFEEYVNTQRPNQKLSEAEISRLKKEFYDGVLTTSFEHKVYNDGWLNGASELLDFIPVVSGVKSTLEGIVGYTLTGEKLSDSERAQYIALGLVSGAVDVLTLGSGAVLTQGLKVAAKSLATSFVKTAAIDIGVGYGTKLVTTGLMNLGLPPEMVMGIHILTNLAYMGYNMSKASNTVDTNSNKEEFEYYKKLVGELDVSTAPNTATFYSGPGNRELAEQFASINGKVTLEMTEGGKYLDGLKLFESGSPLTGDEAAEIWADLSANYAQQASGNVYGFVDGARVTSIFNTVEFPTLQNNPNVTNIFTELFSKGGK